MFTTPLSCKRIVFAVLGVLALVATSCGGSATEAVDTAAGTTADTSSAPAPAADDTSSAPAVAESASLVASTVNGGQIDFGSLQGQDVVLWFWAPW